MFFSRPMRAGHRPSDVSIQTQRSRGTRRRTRRCRHERLESRQMLAANMGDFNGDGIDDLLVGAPFEDVGNIANAGAVYAIYGSDAGVAGNGDTVLHQNSLSSLAESGDRFGEAIAVGDFNADNIADVVIGVPFEDIGAIRDAGAIHVIYGAKSALGNGTRKLFHENNLALGLAETGDRFGQSLAVGDFNNDGIDDLVVGAPNEDVGNVRDAGAITVLYGSQSGFARGQGKLFHQKSTGIATQPGTGERFGWSLAAADFNGDDYADVAIGVPFEDSGAVDAGLVHVVYGGENGLRSQTGSTVSQMSLGLTAESGDRLGFSLASGDFNHDGSDDLAVGIPFKNVDAVRDAGAVSVVPGSAGGLQLQKSKLWHQNAGTIASFAEHRDQFGFDLTAADFDGDTFMDLAVGVPGEDVGTVVDAGVVNVLYGSGAGLADDRNQIWHQNSGGIQSFAEARDGFGMSLSAGDFDNDGRADLVVGVPLEDVGNTVNAGAVNVIYGTANGLHQQGNRLLHQSSSGLTGYSESGDRFGAFGGAVAHSDYDIEVQFLPGHFTTDQQELLVEAAERWSELILGDLPAAQLKDGKPVDDLHVTAWTAAMDGVGNTLAKAGPYLDSLRAGSHLPYRSAMIVDKADVSHEDLFHIAVHEFGHAVGFGGTVWERLSLTAGTGTSDPRFRGEAATREFNSLFGRNESSVPLENVGEEGTKEAHWREEVFQHELMTGVYDSGDWKISRVSVAALQDMGYRVDLDAANDYRPPQGNSALAATASAPTLVTTDTTASLTTSSPRRHDALPPAAADQIFSALGHVSNHIDPQAVIRKPTATETDRSLVQLLSTDSPLLSLPRYWTQICDS